MVVAIVVGVIVILGVSGYAFGGLGTSGGHRTWQEYGISIQYPAGAKAQYSGVLGLQANASSGDVEWLWNGGNTALDLAWVTTSVPYNSTAGLQAVYVGLRARASNVAIIDQGVTTFGGGTWQYQTYRFIINGQTGYATYAVAQYSSSQRAYALGFTDSSNTTLSSLQTYGGTFSG